MGKEVGGSDPSQRVEIEGHEGRRAGSAKALGRFPASFSLIPSQRDGNMCTVCLL